MRWDLAGGSGEKRDQIQSLSVLSSTAFCLNEKEKRGIKKSSPGDREMMKEEIGLLTEFFEAIFFVMICFIVSQVQFTNTQCDLLHSRPAKRCEGGDGRR